jgi:hypothetical protein
MSSCCIREQQVNNSGSELYARGMTTLHMYFILLILVRVSAVVTMEVPQYPFAKRSCYHRQYIALSTGSNSNRCRSLLTSFLFTLGISLPGAARRIHHLSTVLPMEGNLVLCSPVHFDPEFGEKTSTTLTSTDVRPELVASRRR